MTVTVDANIGTMNDKCSFLDDIPYTLCLQQEIEFLNSGDMDLFGQSNRSICEQ
jgi:hypothetical protein